MTILIIALAYLFLVGMAYPFVLDKQVRACPFDRHSTGLTNNRNEMTYRSDRDHHRREAVGTSLFGPLIIPFLIGAYLTNGEDRAAKKRAKELAAVKHQNELAKQQAETLAIREREAGIV